MTAIYKLAISTVLTAVAVSASAQHHSIDLSFGETVIRAGKGPGRIAVADLNHDGKPDIIVANADDGTISVLLGDGKGQFSPAAGSPFSCGKNPNDISIADMNGDGTPDLVIVNTQTPNITILLGNGKGGFQPSPLSPFSTRAYPHPHGVAVGDFMGNGKPAVVTDSWGTSQILLIPSDGRGNLLLPGKFFAADLRSDAGVRAADFNHDGYFDIVTTSQKDNSVGLLLGDGKGGFSRAPGSPFAAAPESWSFAVGDVNRDGNLDVLVTPYERDLTDPKQLGVTVLLGDGKGGFTRMRGSPFSLAGCAGPARIALGDVNDDGATDFAVTCAQNDRVMFFLGEQGGAFRSFSRAVPTGWSGLAIADLHGDGRNEVLVSNYARGTITILAGKR
ncbi:MAG TPA: VCBS repeat-containing protein [Terriglobales bacterium]|nr:VCBS repeat-containing protein [Terriglobales bacterium]